MEVRGFWREDAGGERAYTSLPGTLSLYEDAAVLTHQSTVRKDRRLHQGPEDLYMPSPLLLVIEKGLPVFFRKAFIY